MEKLWEKCQDYANELLGFKKTKGSGNVHGNGDGINVEFMHECKFRNNQENLVPKKDWEKFLEECKNYRKKPMFTAIRPTTSEDYRSYEYFTILPTKDLSSFINRESDQKINKIIDIIVNDKTMLSLPDHILENLLKKINSVNN
jgi:hypothetical protein